MSQLGQALVKVLIAEDEPIFRRMLEASLQKWGFEVVVVSDGESAWQRLSAADAPKLAVLDWVMPGMHGVDICRRIRELPNATKPYCILLTSRGETHDVIAGLEAGADDYITKPFQKEELRARLRVGVRMVDLQRSLAERVLALEEALAQVKQLQGLLPICSWCKKIRDDRNYWQQVETYIGARSEAQFTHSICPECRDKYVEPQLERWRREHGGDERAAGIEPSGST